MLVKGCDMSLIPFSFPSKNQTMEQHTTVNDANVWILDNVSYENRNNDTQRLFLLHLIKPDYLTEILQ